LEDQLAVAKMEVTWLNQQRVLDAAQITDLSNAHEALQETEERLQALAAQYVKAQAGLESMLQTSEDLRGENGELQSQVEGLRSSQTQLSGALEDVSNKLGKHKAARAGIYIYSNSFLTLPSSLKQI